MAKYRQLHTEFWNDGFVLDLTPEEKYFYVYLMTNCNTTQCGVYELPKRIIETQTGYNRETVDKLLKRFEEYNKISYCKETKEIIILNWIKYNQPNNSNAIKCVNREIRNIKNKDFVSILYNQCVKHHLEIKAIFNDIEMVFNDNASFNENESSSNFNKPLASNYEGAYKGLASKEVINKKEEIMINKEEEEVVVISKKSLEGTVFTIADVITFFEKNVYKPKETEYKKIQEWANNISCEVIIMAVEEAVNYNAKSIKYIENILKNWNEKGLNTAEDVKKYQEVWKINKKRSSKNSISTWDFEHREYDFQDLERKLLGIDGG